MLCSISSAHQFCNADRPLRDNLNAGQSGAIAMNLNYELDYLIPRKHIYIYYSLSRY